MIEARRHQFFEIADETVSGKCSSEKMLIGEVRERAGIHHRVVIKRFRCAHPGECCHAMSISLRAGLEEQRCFFVFQIIWLWRVTGQKCCFALFAFFRSVKTRDAIENRASGLRCDDLASRKRTPIADSLHFVENRSCFVALSDVIGVHRVRHLSIVHRQGGSTEGLCDGLASVDASPTGVSAGGEERIGTHCIKGEQCA